MLELLLSENQFELILPETGTSAPDTIRLVYLMNDAVESFLLFHNVRLTGTYDPAYEGELDALLTQDENERYALIVHQGDSVVTLFFEDLTLENHYYDYSQIGHFWMKGYEYLRQLEYRIAILRDKLDYLGENSCNANERELASLAEFPPLNVCCYPAVPEKYRVIRENPWHLTEDASRVFQSIAVEAGDPKLLHRLKDYEQHPTKRRARQIARLLHRNAHAKTVDLLTRKLQKASSAYLSCTFGKAQQTRHLALELLAKKDRKSLKSAASAPNCCVKNPYDSAGFD
ncbi:MAG: DUF3878 family protein [Clostridium fessum]